jgi:hypothetical protein
MVQSLLGATSSIPFLLHSVECQTVVEHSPRFHVFVAKYTYSRHDET